MGGKPPFRSRDFHFGKSSVMVRPREHRVPIKVSDEEIASIDAWRFANQIATRSDAIRQLCRIGMKAKGPAEAATSPDRGSITHPCMRKEEMNEVTNTMAPAATLDISDLENPLADATRMASITSRLIGDCLGSPNEGNKYYLTNNQVEDMLFATYQTADLIKRIYQTWETIFEANRREGASA